MSKQRGFTTFSVFLKRVSSLNPQVRANFVAFSLEKEPGKSLEVRFDFGPRPGFSMTIGFLYGAGAETLIYVTGTSAKYPKICLPAEKPESAVYTQKTKKDINQENRCLGIRC